MAAMLQAKTSIWPASQAAMTSSVKVQNAVTLLIPEPDRIILSDQKIRLQIEHCSQQVCFLTG